MNLRNILNQYSSQEIDNSPILSKISNLSEEELKLLIKNSQSLFNLINAEIERKRKQNKINIPDKTQIKSTFLKLYEALDKQSELYERMQFIHPIHWNIATKSLNTGIDNLLKSTTYLAKATSELSSFYNNLSKSAFVISAKINDINRTFQLLSYENSHVNSTSQKIKDTLYKTI